MDVSLLIEAVILALVLIALLLGLSWVVETTAPPEAVSHTISGSARHS